MTQTQSAQDGFANTLVCFAVKEEATAFRSTVKDNSLVTILLTGIGKLNANNSVRQAIAGQTFRVVLTCGFAGGLNPELASGDVVFATDTPALAEKLSAAGAKPATFHCSATIATTAAEKLALRRLTKADVVEMESEMIQAACRERGIPCATVRVISDAAHEDLPLDFNKLSNPDLSLNYGRLLLAVAKSPGKIPALFRLQKKCRVAAGNLARVLARVTA